jgi:Protein of unknown function (DUF2924)
MPRVSIGPALPDRDEIDVEIARLRDLDVNELRGRWQAAFGRPAPAHLPRHLVFRMVAYQLQAERFGDLDAQSRRRLNQTVTSQTAGPSPASVRQPISQLRPGTTLGREWNGHMQRVSVLPDGFAWNGKTYRSLSQVAFAITGTRWNGPRFFGLRGISAKGTPP